MTNKQLRALFNWRMCSDPWPAEPKDMQIIDNWLDRLARVHGYRDWVDAYHCCAYREVGNEIS